MKPITKYESFTGEVFDTEAACRAHEAKCGYARLVGLALEQIEGAMKAYRLDYEVGEDPSEEDRAIADAIERVGTAITRDRLRVGLVKRKRSSRKTLDKLAAENGLLRLPASEATVDHPAVEALRPDDPQEDAA